MTFSRSPQRLPEQPKSSPLEDAVQALAANPELPSKSLFLLTISGPAADVLLLLQGQLPLPPQMLPLGLGLGDPLSLTLSDQRSLELGNRSNELKLKLLKRVFHAGEGQVLLVERYGDAPAG